MPVPVDLKLPTWQEIRTCSINHPSVEDEERTVYIKVKNSNVTPEEIMEILDKALKNESN